MSAACMNIINRFDEVANANPDATALRHAGCDMSYAELQRRANRLAQSLRSGGVSQGHVVAICEDRSPEAVAQILGVLKVGGAYVIADPHEAPQRRRAMLTGVRPTCAVASDASVVDFPVQAIVQDPPLAGDDGAHADAACPGPRVDSLAHIVFTSGSSGFPKAVEISHGALVNRLQWMWQAHPFKEGDVACIHKPFSLVASPWEIFGGLLQGVPSVLVPRTTLLDASALWETLAAERVTYFLASPLVIESLVEEATRRPSEPLWLRFASTSGAMLKRPIVERWKEAFPQTPLFNMYGLTECASNVAYADVTTVGLTSETVPVGKPIANAKIHILDSQLEPVPQGAVGEVVIAGPCVTRGYRDDPSRTADTFLPDPFSPVQGSRMYRSGDFGRVRADGEFELVGRQDEQVSVRGFRVELGEVATVVASVDGITDCAVVQRDDESLAAYIEAEEAVDLQLMRETLRRELPAYMVPTEFMVQVALPRTVSGKVDRQLLGGSHARRLSLAGVEPPATSDEQAVADIWSKMIGVPQVSRTDNFFDIGGHSLLAAMIVSKVNETLGAQIELRHVFDYPTVEGLTKAALATRENPS